MTLNPFTEPHVASSSILPFLRAAKEQGINIEDFLAPFNLTPDSLKRQQTRLPSSQYSTLLHKLIEISDDPWLGLHTAKYVGINSYDINGYISANCSSPLEAVKLTADLHRIISDQRTLSVSETQDKVISSWQLSLGAPPITRNMAEHLMTSYVIYGHKILQLDDAPLYAKFQHSAPKNKEILARYEEIFQCPLLFDQETYCLAVDRGQARDLIIPQADPVLRDMLIGHANTRIQAISSTSPFTYQVKGLIKQLLDRRVPCRESVAEHLNIGSRTLQRRLLAEGSSFKDAFNDVRQELALHYLRDNTMTLEDIAEKLGFSETRSFHRSFKQWTGETAGAYRNKLQEQSD